MHTISLYVELGNILMAVYTNVSSVSMDGGGFDKKKNSFVLLLWWRMNYC